MSWLDALHTWLCSFYLGPSKKTKRHDEGYRAKALFRKDNLLVVNENGRVNSPSDAEAGAILRAPLALRSMLL